MLQMIHDLIDVGISDEKKKKIYVLIARIHLLSLILKWYVQKTNPVWFLSFMKCGRTWLRLMIGKALQLHFDIHEYDVLKLVGSKKRFRGFPRIALSHEDSAHWKKPEELTESKEIYMFKKVIFLVRDPRDVVVSLYFEKSKRLKSYIDGEKLEHSDLAERIKPYEDNLHNFLYEPVGSFETILNYYNIWEKNRHIPESFLLVRYEDIHQNPQRELRRILDFIEMSAVTDEVIDKAVKFASFDHIHAMEKEDKFKRVTLKSANKADPMSMKTRKGKVGGFIDYFTPADIEYMNSKIKSTLSDYYGYNMHI